MHPLSLSSCNLYREAKPKKNHRSAERPRKVTHSTYPQNQEFQTSQGSLQFMKRFPHILGRPFVGVPPKETKNIATSTSEPFVSVSQLELSTTQAKCRQCLSESPNDPKQPKRATTKPLILKCTLKGMRWKNYLRLTLTKAAPASKCVPPPNQFVNCQNFTVSSIPEKRRPPRMGLLMSICLSQEKSLHL